ncbi:MAG: ABC transporter ATP-binding protein, partial [Planctomycetota bacterium]
MADNDNEVLIEVRGLSKVYRMGNTDIHALRDVDLDVIEGEYLSVMGPSGSGKSTLFNMIGALDDPSGGTVTIAGVDLTALTSRQRAYIRNAHIGYIFQAYNLIGALTARYNVMLPLLFAGKNEHDAGERADEVLTEV